MASAAHMQAASPQGGAYYSAPSNAPDPQAVFSQTGELAGGPTRTGGPTHAAYVPPGQMAYEDSVFNYNFGDNNYSFRRQRRLRGQVPKDLCTRCSQKGHWRAQCPVAGARAEIGASEANSVQGVAFSSKRSETCIVIMIKGRHAQALLDTGCERSVCLLRLCRNAKLTPVNTELFAANNTPISMLSTTRLIFEVQGMTLFADVFVFESIDELILGFEWLNKNNCDWLFGRGRVTINGRSIQLHTRTPASAVRRIFVRKNVCIPPDCSENVPVRMPFVNMHTPRSD